MTSVTDLTTDAPMLWCRGIHIAFGGIPVLRDVSIRLEPGTVTALAGENGAGKSTLMKIASGQYRPDAGRVEVRGESLPAGHTQAAYTLGVAIVPQELASIPEMMVYENLFVGREITNRLGVLNRSAMIDTAREQLEAFGLDTDPKSRMEHLPIGVRQIVEIIKATNRGARVLLLDEPTSAIAKREVALLVKVVLSLRDTGVAVLFTTHKMEEIRAMADRVVVLRDGRLVADSPLVDISDDEIVTAMIGRELETLFPELPAAGTEVVLEVADLVVVEGADPINFVVRRGEILGLAGLVGAGRTELIECIYGVRKPVSGTVTVSGERLTSASPRSAIKAGLAIVPEDRKGAGVVLSMSVLDNATLPRMAAFTRFGLLLPRRKDAIGAVMESMRLKSNGLAQHVENLSGGNQQKVVLGRWLTGTVDALLLDEPTRGVDVGARSEIYRIITDLSASGLAVIMASSDMPEILSLSHRALVLRGFSVVAELDRAQLGAPDVQDLIFRIASGQDSPTTKETE